MRYYPNQDIISEQRFGFGPLYEQGSLPLDKQLNSKTYWHESVTNLPSTNDVLLEIRTFNEAKRKLKQSPTKKREVQKQLSAFFKQQYLRQVEARNLQTLYTPYGFQERLIQFWSNHFAISADTRKVQPIVASVENEVIRQYWNGNFVEMLLAVTQHPTMLMFLDNNVSVGPNSKQGSKKNKGLNENLAREILELHTLGVDSQYTQQDVIELSKAITGWSVGFKAPRVGFHFNSTIHEPGAITLLGKRYSQKGLEQGKACLRDLALHPDTARHLARKLVQHFVGPSGEMLVESLSQIYLEAKGDLLPVYHQLIQSSPSQSAQPLRFRTSQEWLFAVLRSAGGNFSDSETAPMSKSVNRLLGAQRNLGQPPFMSGSPAGWPDKDADYNSPSALTQRWQVSNQVARLAIKRAKTRGISEHVFVEQISQNLYGDALDEHSRLVIEKAPTAEMKLSLLWLSPQFQYR
ncbi:DUF1800 domain-containing protein [Vibrio alfacsensis]|uniref:DUF1800 domain-containing protein n=1 Tax=Vibrio alfacsensis TaxID=1074311 RepID=UPI0040688027